MGLIPLSADPIRYKDESTGMVYILRAPCDKVEIEILEFQKKYPEDIKERTKLFEENEMSLREWFAGICNIILIGWENHPMGFEFPEYNPASFMHWTLRRQIINYWHKCQEFTVEDQKK